MSSTVEEEIELIERVLFRLGTAENDEKFEFNVGKFLTPLLLKITSPHDTVRCKVMEALTHINKRLKTRPQVQLPVAALLEQYQMSDSAFLHNFSIIYVTMGFPRLSFEKQIELAPIVLNCLEGKSENHQDKLLMLILPLLESIKIPEDPEQRSKLFGLSDKPSSRKQFLSLIHDVLLLPYGTLLNDAIPFGMSPYSLKRVSTNNWKTQELEALKKGICRFLCSGVFPIEDVLILILLASADTRASVSTAATVELNKVTSSLDWNDPKLTEPIYTLFLGNGSKIAERKTTPANVRVRQKLLQYLLKTRGKGINTVRGIQVIFESLFSVNTNARCKVLALQFTENLVKDGPKDLIDKISKVILSGIVKLIGASSTEPYDIQNPAYCAFAQLIRKCPDLVNKDLQLVVSYFEHLSQAPVELHDSIREALIAIAAAFRYDASLHDEGQEFIPDSNQKLLLAMLNDHAESKLVIMQNVACNFLVTCFPENFVPARYLLLLIAGESPSLREVITQHLYGTTRKDHINYAYISTTDNRKPIDADDELNQLSNEQRRVLLPSFKTMINYVHEMSEKRLASSSVPKAVYGKVVIGYSYETYTEILEYLHLCLWYSAGIRSNPNDSRHISQLAAYITTNYKPKPDNELEKYLHFVKKILWAKRGTTELTCLHDLLNAEVEILSTQCFDLLEKFSSALRDVSESTRVLVAEIVGVLWATSGTISTFNGYIKENLTSLPQKPLENRHGCILAVAHAFHRKIRSLQKQGQLTDDQLNNWPELKNTVDILITNLSDTQTLLVSAAVKGITLLGSIIALPLPAHDTTYNVEEKMDVDGDPQLFTKSYVARILLKIVKSTSAKAKIREEAAACLGFLAIGDGKYFTKGNLNAFISLLKLSRDAALYIALAQGIVLTVLGHEKTVNEQDEKLITEGNEVENPHCDNEMLGDFVNRIIKVVPEPNPASRLASGIWLLALVKNCSTRPPIYKRKQILQFAFTELLSDDSEFVQDVASRGLGLVFSLSDPGSQTDLANSLLDQLLGGRRQVNQVTEDTQLFEEGVLGKTPTGGNITTYKELCSLASDLNQPEMIYQFMQLANHNAAWNSKLGAAFGLKSISKAAQSQMQPYLGKIVPRLYRYKYDPTPKIQNSMISIWDSLVKDSKEVIEAHYWAILDELITNLTDKEWRVRIACCLAIRDLIKRANGLRLRYDERKLTTKETVSASKMEVDKEPQPGPSNAAESSEMEIDEPLDEEPELKQLWIQLFRVMDDYHEGTRLAAEGTAKTLSKICVVAASSNLGKSGKVVVGTILPIILEVGVTHTVAEIRSLSMKTLSEIIDASGSLLTSHLPTLVPCLLKATGELEVPKLSYMSTRLGGNAEAQELVDSIRAEAAKQHHSTETLAKCIRYIDYDSLEKMTSDIIELIKSTVNLGTKVACAHFICLITVRFNKEMQPLVGRYLSACFSGLKDRNNIVRKYNATAIGHLVGIAKDQSVIRLFAKLGDFYLENQSNKGVPQTVAAINKRHQEMLKDYSEHVLPLIFFAMHEQITEDNRETVEQWKELWTEVSPGDAGIRLNLNSILPVLERSLENPSWLIKAQSANAINTIATRLGPNLDDAQRNSMIKSLLNSVSGRTFQGKDSILHALAGLCNGLKKDDSQTHKQIIDAVMKECHKEEPVYRTQALRAIGDILERLNEDRFEEVYKMIWYLMDKKDLASVTGDDDDKNMTSDERKKDVMIFINLKEAVCETLGKAWPADSIGTQRKYQRLFVERCVQCLQNNTRPVQLALLKALGKFVERLKALDKTDDTSSIADSKEKKMKIETDENLQGICKDILSAVVYVSGIPHTGLKKEALSIILALTTRLIERKATNELNLVKKTFNEILQTLERDTAPEVKIRLKDIDDKLKNA